MAGRVTQLTVEAVIAPEPNLIVSWTGLEVMRYGDPNLIISQAGLEVLRVPDPSEVDLLVSQVGVEVAWELPKGTFTLDARFQPAPTTKTFGSKSVFYGYSGAPIVIKEGARGPSVEFVIPGCDLTITGSPITISWDVWQSHFQWSVDKKEVIYIRRDSLTGLAIWSDDPQKDETDAGNNATGRQWHFYGSYTETARSGRYVLTVKPAKGNASLYASKIHFTLATPGEGPGISLDAVIRKTQPKTFSLKARILKPAGPITMTDDGTVDAVVFAHESGSVDVNATLFVWGLGAFFTYSMVSRTATSSFPVEAKIVGTPVASFPADAILGLAGTGSFVAEWAYNSSHFYLDARIYEPYGGGWVEPGDFAVSAAIFRVFDTSDPSLGWVPGIILQAIRGETFTSAIVVDAVVLGEVSRSSSLDAAIFAASPVTLSVDAFIAGAAYLDAFIKNLGVCVWTTPGDTVVIGQNETLAFLIPVAGRNMHFEIQLDTVNTFDSPDLRTIESHRHLAGWEYWDGAWVPIPQSGVDPSFAGSEARYTIQDPLAGGVWYRRVRAGVI